jgi:hypothetical protein
MPSRKRADKEQSGFDDPSALISQLGNCLTFGFANEVEHDGGQIRVEGQFVLRIFRFD